MALDAVTNFGYATLSAGIDSDDTSITLTTGHGARLPAGPFNAVIWDTSYGSPTAAYHASAAEIVRVTSRSTDTLTVTRAQEDTTARSFNTSGRTYAIGVALTKATYDAIAPAASPTFTGTITSSGAVVSAGTAMTGEQINVALRDNLYSATADVTWTHSATPAVGQEYGVIVTTDGTARTITYPVTVFSQARGGDITSSTFPASSTVKIIVRRTASGYLILGDPLTTAQIQALLALTSSAISDFNSATRAQVEAELVAGSNITLTPSGSGASRQITIASSGGGGSSNVTLIQGPPASITRSRLVTLRGPAAATDRTLIPTIAGRYAGTF